MANQYHEPVGELTQQDRNYVRALMSLKEEIEAVDWYHQRVATCPDPQLKSILAHNRDEEIEHAVMALEWLRRNMPGWDEQMRTYLFTEGDVTAIEEAAEVGEASEVGGRDVDEPVMETSKPTGGGLGIGSLKKIA